ncbi:tRNA modification GTPase MnmE [Tanacetum coccineum]
MSISLDVISLVLVYYIWQGTNVRLFQKEARTADAVFKFIVHMVRHKLMGLKIRNFMEVVKAARIWNLTLKAIIKDGERIILNGVNMILALKSIYEDGFESAITCINNEYHINTEISAWSGKSWVVYTSVWQNWFCSGTDNTLILNKDERVGSSSPSINQPDPDANSSSIIVAILTSLGGQAIPTSHVVEYGVVCDPFGNVVDEVFMIPMLSPRSFTREDVVELQCHGSDVCLHRVLRACLEAGTRLAEPGEITLRAFLNGRLDLSQAEDVGKLVSAKSVAAADAALAGIQA